MENTATAPAAPSAPQFLFMLPFRSEQVGDPDANYDVSVWRSAENVCEDRDGATRCDTASGLYYGSAEDEVTKFCPRHFYAMHAGEHAAYRLIDTGRSQGTLADAQFVAVLPFGYYPVGDSPEEASFDLALWRCNANACEGAGEDSCDGTGFFYGSDSAGAPVLCARHFYTDTGYALIDATEEQFARLQLLDACNRARMLLYNSKPEGGKAHRAWQVLEKALQTAHADPYCYGLRPEVAVRAAGPDLLRACRLALRDLEGLNAEEERRESLSALRQAIARATGKSE